MLRLQPQGSELSPKVATPVELESPASVSATAGATQSDVIEDPPRFPMKRFVGREAVAKALAGLKKGDEFRIDAFFVEPQPQPEYDGFSLCRQISTYGCRKLVAQEGGIYEVKRGATSLDTGRLVDVMVGVVKPKPPEGYFNFWTIDSSDATVRQSEDRALLERIDSITTVATRDIEKLASAKLAMLICEKNEDPVVRQKANELAPLLYDAIQQATEEDSTSRSRLLPPEPHRAVWEFDSLENFPALEPVSEPEPEPEPEPESGT